MLIHKLFRSAKVGLLLPFASPITRYPAFAILLVALLAWALDLPTP